MAKIQYISCIPGSGKTHDMIKAVLSGYEQDKNYIICVPTIKLMESICKDFLKCNVITRNIISAYEYETTEQQLLRAISEAIPIIFITHAALMTFSMQTFYKCSEYTLIMDEALNIGIAEASLELSKFFGVNGLGRKLFKITPYKGNKEVDVLTIPTDCVHKAKDYLREKDSTTSVNLKDTHELIKNVLNKTRLVLMREQCTNKHINRLNSKESYTLVTLHNPLVYSKFKNVVILSAFFEHTLMYHLLKLHYSDSVVNITHKRNLQDMTSRYAKLYLTYAYGDDDDHNPKYSMGLRKRVTFIHRDQIDDIKKYRNEHKDGLNSLPKKYKMLSLGDYYSKIIEHCNEFGDDTLTVMNREGIKDAVIGDTRGFIKHGIRIGARSHGLNEYIQKTSVAIIAVFNPKQTILPLYRALLPDYCLETDRNICAYVQAITRTAVRDIKSSNNVHALVPTLYIATRLRHIICKELDISIKKGPKIVEHSLHKIYSLYTIIDPRPSYVILPNKKNNEKKLILKSDYDSTKFKTTGIVKGGDLFADGRPKNPKITKNGKVKVTFTQDYIEKANAKTYNKKAIKLSEAAIKKLKANVKKGILGAENKLRKKQKSYAKQLLVRESLSSVEYNVN